jgi:hypothetical protein
MILEYFLCYTLKFGAELGSKSRQEDADSNERSGGSFRNWMENVSSRNERNVSRRSLGMALTAACNFNRVSQQHVNGDEAFFGATLASGQIDDQRRTAQAGHSARQP